MKRPKTQRVTEGADRYRVGPPTSGPVAIPRQRDAKDSALASLAVIVPTRNESGNVAPLVQRLSEVLEGHDAEVLFVDDSDDDTPDQVRLVAQNSRLPVGLHHRRRGARDGGLGGAVIDGLQRVDKPWAVVMDGDLQHPPELVPALLERASSANADLVVASRHAQGGSSSGLANLTRIVVSRLCIALAKVLFPRPLHDVSDPMSGFFVVRSQAVDPRILKPQGFKILLEIAARTPGLRCAEVPFTFGERLSGESKACMREGWRFLRQLTDLWVSRIVKTLLSRSRPPGAVSRALVFGVVGLTGLAVNTALMWLLADGRLGLNYLVAAIIATQGSSTWNFALTDSLVYRGPKRYTPARRWLAVLGLNNAVLVARIPLLAALVTGLGMHYLAANLITLSLGFLVRFSGQERLSLVKEAS